MHSNEDPRPSNVGLNSQLDEPNSIRVRCFQKSDIDRVRKLFRDGMVLDDGSVGRAVLLTIMRSPSFYATFALFILSVAVEIVTFPSWSTYQDLPNSGSPIMFKSSRIRIAIAAAVIAFLSFLYLCYLVYTTFGVVVKFYFNSLREDFVDIQGHYELRAANGSDEEGLLEPTGYKGFWVAEIASPATGKSEIVGIIGLDKSPRVFDVDPEPNAAELRRMIVSRNYRGRGIASALIQVCEAHARASKLSTIILQTTIFQPSARKLYSKFGYKIMIKKDIPWGLGYFAYFFFRKDLSLEE